MKITQINAYPALGNGDTTAIDISVITSRPVTEALASVLALFAGQASYDADNAARQAMQAARNEQGIGGTGTLAAIVGSAPTATSEAEANVVEEPAPKATRTRRPRTNPDAAPSTTGLDGATPEQVAQSASAVADAMPTERRRTRVTQEPAAPEVKVITDADLARACSNAAAIVGQGPVTAVLREFHVNMVSALAPDVREKFIEELDIEIELAKEEAALEAQIAAKLAKTSA